MNIIFICTHNRCRSILAEAITRKISNNKIIVVSAGSDAAGKVHPDTLKNLQRHGYDITGLTSKSWDDFTDLRVDVAITVCNSAANETCPMWFGDAIKVHWGLSDPSDERLSKEQSATAFDTVINILEKRIKHLNQFDLDDMNKQQLEILFNTSGELI